jgi:hypothetical protein
MKKTLYMLTAAAGLGCAGIAEAASAEIEAAKAQCIVGEQADGYLGIIDASKASEDLRRDVRANNQQRKALYADFAERNGVTIETAAALFAEKSVNQAPSGQCIRDADGTWYKKP